MGNKNRTLHLLSSLHHKLNGDFFPITDYLPIEYYIDQGPQYGFKKDFEVKIIICKKKKMKINDRNKK